jgi:hypothetical protein
MRRGDLPLAVWLLLIAIANQRAQVTVESYFKFGSRCLGMEGSRGTITGKVTRALDCLHKQKLVEIVDQRYDTTVVRLLALDRTEGPYQMPRREEQKIIHLPATLFANGWHVALAPAELTALLIAFCEESFQFGKVGAHQWQKTRRQLHADYGIAESTWSEAKEGLRRWGLLTYNPVPIRGRLPIDRYTVDHGVLDHSPAETPEVVAVGMARTIKAPGTGDPIRITSYMHVPGYPGRSSSNRRHAPEDQQRPQPAGRPVVVRMPRPKDAG